MKSSIDRVGRLVIPKEIIRLSVLKPVMPLDVRWDNETIVITLASLTVKLQRNVRLLVAVAAKKTPRLSTETVNRTRNAQHQGFTKLVDRAHRDSKMKWFTKLEDLP